MKAVQIKPNIYWVGARDWNVRDFHGYKTHRGTTYNAYLIIDTSIVLVDTVKPTCRDEMMARISSVVDPSKIDLIVSNHVEMDHSGCLTDILQLAPKAQVLTSPNGARGLAQHFDTHHWNIRTVKSGESISVGKRSIQFALTPMVHWPDSMVTYIPEEKLLLPNDAFGQHMAHAGLFDDDVPVDIVLEEAAKYYANIVYPYGGPVQKAMSAVATLPIDMIAPSHGIIWRSHIPRILDKYRNWMNHVHEEKALIIYDSMWGATETMAKTIHMTLDELHVPVTSRSLKQAHISDIMTDVLDAKYIFIGTPTLNNTVLPTMAAMLSYLKGLRPAQKTGMAFGSYGWFANALREVDDTMRALEWKTYPALNVQYVPSLEKLDELKTAIQTIVKENARA